MLVVITIPTGTSTGNLMIEESHIVTVAIGSVKDRVMLTMVNGVVIEAVAEGLVGFRDDVYKQIAWASSSLSKAIKDSPRR